VSSPAALQEIASEMAGNLESMPSPTGKVVATAMAVNKAASNLKGFSSKRLVGEGSDAERTRVLEQLGHVCEFLLSKPELVVQLQVESGDKCNAEFLASFIVQQQAFKPTEEDEAATKVQAAIRGKQARVNFTK
jgi:hypothetical protein